MRIEQGDFAHRLARARAQTAALRAIAYEAVSRIDQGEAASPAPVGALYFAELAQRVHALALDVIGADALVREPDDAGDDWPTQYLETFRHTIAGGTSEIRRNIIAERMLGLPR